MVLALGLGHAHGAEAAGAPADTVRAAASADSNGPAIEGHPIARVDVDPHDIFDPAPSGRLAPIYRLADRLHFRTRASTIRHHVLIAPGEPWSEARARESERALRALDIFDAVRVSGQSSGDSVVASVWTRDAWTTSPEFALERGGGQLFGSMRFSERNLFGRAKLVSVAYRQDPTGVSRSIALADPGVNGSRVRLAASASGGSSGTVNGISVGLPFYAEDTPHSFGVAAERASTTERLFDSGREVATFAQRLAGFQVSAGRGWRSGRTIKRVNGSFLVIDRNFGGSTLQPGAPVEFAGGEERLRLRRFTVEGRLWRPAFVERVGVDRLDGIEDFDLGRSLELSLGFSPQALGGSADEGYAALRVDCGTDAHRLGFGWVHLQLSSRLLEGPREATGRVEARWVNQAIPRQTLVLAALGAGGWRTARDHQLVVGGLDGLRAHDVHALAGDQLWRLNAESRWLLRRDFQQLVSLGAAAFWDAARTWGPGSGDAPWQHDVGFGLRLGLPRSALNRVARFDIAWSVSPSGPGPRKPVFSFGSSQAF
jgi:hypothetical protein